MNSPWTQLDTLVLYSIELCSQKEDSILKSNKMKKKNYQKPSMTVAEFVTKDLVLCTSGFGAVGGLGSYSSDIWYPFGPYNGGDLN